MRSRTECGSAGRAVNGVALLDGERHGGPLGACSSALYIRFYGFLLLLLSLLVFIAWRSLGPTWWCVEVRLLAAFNLNCGTAERTQYTECVLASLLLQLVCGILYFFLSRSCSGVRVCCYI